MGWLGGVASGSASEDSAGRPCQCAANEPVVLGMLCANFFPVSGFFQPNISHRGRMARGVIGALCLIAGIIVAGDVEWWVGLIFVVAGLFAIFEAVTRWCLVRACGIKTKV